jgi:hypothetical protein
MRIKTVISAATFKALFSELFTRWFIYSLPRQCGLRRRCPPHVTPVELLQAMVFHTVADSGTLAQHVKHLTGKNITDGALAQRRALMPATLFQRLMGAALKPKADPIGHPDAFYHGLRLCGVDGSLFSITNTPQVKKQMRKARSRRGRAAFPKVGAAVMVELGLHNPLAAALGANGESEMALAKEVLSAQPAQSLLLGDRYYGAAAVLVGLSGQQERHFLVRVKENLKRRLLETYADGSALVEIRSGENSRWVREILGKVQRSGRGAATVVRLWTSLLDWKAHPAGELLALYARRWEQEIFYKELKVDAQSSACLQSHTPLTAIQEIAALILAYAVLVNYVWLSLGNTANVQDRYEITAFAAEARSKALGGITSVAGFNPQNLAALWPPAPYENQNYSTHQWHSAEFRFSNAEQNNYWKTLLGRDGFNLK